MRRMRRLRKRPLRPLLLSILCESRACFSPSVGCERQFATDVTWIGTVQNETAATRLKSVEARSGSSNEAGLFQRYLISDDVRFILRIGESGEAHLVSRNLLLRAHKIDLERRLVPVQARLHHV